MTQIVAATWMVLAAARAIMGAVAVSSGTGGRVDPEFAFFLVDALAGVLGLVQLLALILGGLWLYLFVVAAREINRERGTSARPTGVPLAGSRPS